MSAQSRKGNKKINLADTLSVLENEYIPDLQKKEQREKNELQANINKLESLKDKNFHLEKKEKNGQLFEADIPENDVLLDEDLPFSKQPENVQKKFVEALQSLSDEEFRTFCSKIFIRDFTASKKTVNAGTKLNCLQTLQKAFLLGSEKNNGFSLAIRKRTLKENGYSDEQIETFINDIQAGKIEAEKLDSAIKQAKQEIQNSTAEDQKNIAEKLSGLRKNPAEALADVPGNVLYKNIAYALAEGKQAVNKEERASKFLNEHGIEGITYDGKQDGRCFVVFDDKAISVMEKYYQQQNDVKLAEERLQEDLQAWDKTWINLKAENLIPVNLLLCSPILHLFFLCLVLIKISLYQLNIVH